MNTISRSCSRQQRLQSPDFDHQLRASLQRQQIGGSQQYLRQSSRLMSSLTWIDFKEITHAKMQAPRTPIITVIVESSPPPICWSAILPKQCV